MKNMDVTIDGIKYHAIHVSLRPGNRLIIRTKAAGGQVFRVDSHKIHRICYDAGGEKVTLHGIYQSSGNNTRVEEIEFLIAEE